jgi:molybdate transport system substrate-binding protein
VLLSILLSAAPAGGREVPTPEPLNVFAAASLTEVFKAIAVEFRQFHPGIPVQFNFAGSSTLVAQIREGAPAGVFASADEASMQKLADTGELGSAPHVFATNRLAIAVPVGNPKRIATLGDLTRKGLTLALAAPTVPAGKYAAEAFAKAGLAVPAASQELDVKAVLNKVALGEVDAGIVYVTDVRAAAGRVAGVAIPDQYNVAARYPIAVLMHAASPARAATFVAFVLSEHGRKALTAHGFLPP